MNDVSPHYFFGENNDRKGADCGICPAVNLCPIFLGPVAEGISKLLRIWIDLPWSAFVIAVKGFRDLELDREDKVNSDYILGGVVSVLDSITAGTFELEETMLTKSMLPDDFFDIFELANNEIEI